MMRGGGEQAGLVFWRVVARFGLISSWLENTNLKYREQGTTEYLEVKSFKYVGRNIPRGICWLLQRV